MKPSRWFCIGIVLLTTNQPLGWGAMLICDALALKHHDTNYFYLGFLIYGLSWIMLGIGVLMAGPEGVKYSRILLRRLLKSRNNS